VVPVLRELDLELLTYTYVIHKHIVGITNITRDMMVILSDLTAQILTSGRRTAYRRLGMQSI
jgi:hypothetical protein